jgi:hypothetical protein
MGCRAVDSLRTSQEIASCDDPSQRLSRVLLPTAYDSRRHFFEDSQETTSCRKGSETNRRPSPPTR